MLTEEPKCFEKPNFTLENPQSKELLVSGSKLSNFIQQTFDDFKKVYSK